MKNLDFKNEVLEISEKIGVNPKEIHLRDMKNKWASCSSRGRLTFSSELLEKDFEERIRIIIHELLHLKYQKHTKLFDSMLSYHLKKLIAEYK